MLTDQIYLRNLFYNFLLLLGTAAIVPSHMFFSEAPTSRYKEIVK